MRITNDQKATVCMGRSLRSEAGGLPGRTDQQRSGDGSKKIKKLKTQHTTRDDKINQTKLTHGKEGE